MSQPSELSEHVALITGAGKRLGRAFAEALAGRGAGVVVHYGRSKSEAEEVVAGIGSHGGRAIALRADLADPRQTRELFERSVESFGTVDLLINSASLFGPIDFAETTLEAWERHMAVNLTAPMLLSQALAEHRRGRSGSIVNLLDWRARRPLDDHFPYIISKAALDAMTRSLAVALAPDIRVNGLALGAILPPSTGESGADLSEVPMGRLGSVQETVESLLFLLTGPGYITGEVLTLDGGRNLK